LHAKIARAAALLPLLIALALGVHAFWLEPASLHNEDHTLDLPGWPVACDGLRVATLADIHVGSPWNGLDKLAEIVALTNAAQPDVILLAGDYVIHGVLGGDFTPPEDAARQLAGLSAPLGVYAVLGNHDWWLDGPRVIRALQSAGITVLEDRSRRITKGSCELWLAGISDLDTRPHDFEAALRGIPAQAPVIAFTHNPDVFPSLPRRVSLTVAGHTHGGQVDLPWLGRLVVPSRFGDRFAIGHVVEDGRHLFVSSGLGTSILPVRFRVPPEISVLELRSRAATVAQGPGDVSSS
jgi:predicted MPP superfamily phosphohydrolase